MVQSNNYFQNWLEDEPVATYFSAAPFTGGQTSPTARRWHSGQLGNVRNEYWGQFGEQLRAGQTPSMNFTQFLEDYPWTQRYTTAGRPGADIGQFSPGVRRFY